MFSSSICAWAYHMISFLVFKRRYQNSSFQIRKSSSHSKIWHSGAMGQTPESPAVHSKTAGIQDVPHTVATNQSPKIP